MNTAHGRLIPGRNALVLLSPFAVLALWFLLTGLSLVNPLFLPTPGDVASKAIELLVPGAEASLWPDALATLYRMFAGFALAVAAGIPIGLAMGRFARAYLSSEFVFDFFRSIPAIALFPLFLLLLGAGDGSQIAIVAWSCAFIIILNTIYGVRHVRGQHLQVARAFSIRGAQLFRKVILPASLPHVFAGLRTALSIGLIVAVAAEMLTGTSVGLGRRIMDAQLVYRIPEMYFAIIIAGVIGYFLNKGFLHIERHVVHWGGK